MRTTPSIRLFLITFTASASLLGLGLPMGPGGGFLPAAAAQGGEAASGDLTGEIDGHLERAQALLDELLAVEGPRTIENTLEVMNRLSIELDGAGAKASLMENVHPDAAVREAAEKATQKVSAFTTELSLNRGVYDALVQVKVDGADPATARYLENTLRDYHRAGVDKDEATRERIRKLREELVEIGQEFDRNIREGRRFVYLDSADELEGLPQDYIAAHAPGEDGKIEISTAYPDYIPVMSYAKSPELRRAMYHEFLNRAYPENREVLKRLLEKRYELAQTLGYENWAAYITEDKMVKTPENAAEFLGKLDQATRKRAAEDYAVLLERKRRDDPAAAEVFDWEKAYYTELVKSEQFQFDSQELRAYYNYPAVKQGLMNLTSILFSVRFEPVPDAEVWHEDVECYDMFEDDRLRGRFYLDMHPREGKYSHAAQFTVATGIRDVQIPVGALVCNFPEPDASGLALMEHEDVETFLHEFGHLLHHLLGGNQRWVSQSGVATEWDFVEAPSQMLEEWALDAATLRNFARHHETGEPIPQELIDNLRRAREFGNGLYVRQQTFYSAISLNAYNRPPSEVDMNALVPELQAKYSSYSYIPDTHMYASFGHLEGYSAMYYTYMWSLVIAKDLFSRFEGSNLVNPMLAREYRRLVLEPGGTKDAAELVRDFLGRPYNFDAFERWLNAGS